MRANSELLQTWSARALTRRALPQDPIQLARYLVGKHLVRRIGPTLLVGRIVETEAYHELDPASHSFRGPTARNRSMYLARGYSYVYLIYGMWFCLNVSAGKAGGGAAALLRALEPVEGAIEMWRGIGPSAKRVASGPGKLCRALQIDRAQDGLDLTNPDSDLWLASGDKPTLAVSARIGITRAADAPLRFYEAGNAYVSGRKN